MSEANKGVPWPIWALITILAASIGAYAVIEAGKKKTVIEFPPPPPVSSKKCDRCKGTGEIKTAETCKLCEGKGFISCATCLGTGGVSDPFGRAYICPSCNGARRFSCFQCSETGKVPSTATCPKCDGTGKI